MVDASKCPVCKEPLQKSFAHSAKNADAYDVDCPNCGDFSMAGILGPIVENQRGDRPRAVLSYAIRKMDRTNGRPFVGSNFEEGVIKQDHLPDIDEQLENLVLYLGKSLPEAGATLDFDTSAMRGVLGCISERAAAWLLRQASNVGSFKAIAVKI